MKNILLAGLLAVLYSACSRPVPEGPEKREMFDAKGKQVIASFANRRFKTMSVLYGNAGAAAYALSDYKTHQGNEVFELVTYRQADNKFWYGSYINGAVQSDEIVYSADSVGAVVFRYKLERGGAPSDSVGRLQSGAQRIKSILSHRPSVYPKISLNSD